MKFDIQVETVEMGKYKENSRYNVVSMRISDEEKLVLEELMQQSSKSISKLMREAIRLYTPQLNNVIGQQS